MFYLILRLSSDVFRYAPLVETMTIRIAMWSGPRNISTAMMRSWGNRADTLVCDEPLYAHYLKVTGKDHPGAQEVIEHHETDWRTVIDWLIGPVPHEKSVFYQKHMAHHLLPEIDRAWLDEVTNCFLIRDPREMLTSLINNVPLMLIRMLRLASLNGCNIVRLALADGSCKASGRRSCIHRTAFAVAPALGSVWQHTA